MTGHAQHPLDRLLEDVIGEEGGTCRPRDIRDELVGVIERVTAELEAAGQEMAEFCHWSVNEGVGVFTFIGEELSIYVVPCPANRQWELINRFDRMPATDVEAYRARLNARYGKSKPDLVIKPDLAYDWLYGDRPVADAGDGWTEELWTGELWSTSLRTDTSTQAAEPTEPVFPTSGGEPTPDAETEAGAETGAEARTTAADAQAEGAAPANETTATAVESTQEAGGTDGDHPDPVAAEEREETLLTLLDAPTLEDMMAAVRAAGGGKGRPLRRSDFE